MRYSTGGLWVFLILFGLVCSSCRKGVQTGSIKAESLETLYQLTDALVDLQIKDRSSADFGAVRCLRCSVLHTRAGEAVYPFAVAYRHSGKEKYLETAIAAGNWLITQQTEEGSWYETPETWTGTTADQLLMMACAFPILQEYLSSEERRAWQEAIKEAADYLEAVMNPRFASINYCATTASALAVTNLIIPDERYSQKAQELALQVVAKMDEDGFITGEGGRIGGVKYGVDLGYALDMTLWGLGLYAKLTNHLEVDEAVKKALPNHLPFIYPDGSVDASWGIRSNKWTTYGSKTADGCQILFSLYTPVDSRYRTAALRNLAYLRGMMKDSMVGYGPHFWDLFDTPPCIYPTFVRAKNLALAVEFGEQQDGKLPALPTDQVGWARLFPTVDVVLARSENFMATVTAYNYKDLQQGIASKYMHRPTGGSISNLWVSGHGFLQTSSQTIYRRWEPMHFPELEDSIICLTPRIEFRDDSGYYTNLYEFDGRISVSRGDRSTAIISTGGELKNSDRLPGGVAYVWTHEIFDEGLLKSVKLRYHGRKPAIRIIEPFVQQSGMTFELVDPLTVLIQGGKREFKLEIVEGAARIVLGREESRYWHPFPSLKCYPVTLELAGGQSGFEQTVTYRISIL
ncbi:MAG: hypothetical protein ACETWG_00715 [Candidatus Neomarinimicrobiota bacterium]